MNENIYRDVEQSVKPVLIHHARRLSQAMNMPFDDAFQEGRIALFRAMAGYDYNRSHGGLHRFADRVLRNNNLTIMYRDTTSPRVPHTVYRDGGKTKVLKHRLASLDELGEREGRAKFEAVSPDCDPEESMADDQVVSKRRSLVMRLYNKLGERERVVFDCKCRPHEKFMVFMKNIGLEEPTHAAIARYIGVSKNAVDYSAHIIRDTFTKLAEREFPELVQDCIDGGTWPMIHVSRHHKPDQDFITKMIRERGLDPRPSSTRDIETCDQFGREATEYPWGAVVILHKVEGDEWRTLVIEGRFNKNTGGVFGSTDGTHKSVTDEVPWYAQLQKALSSR